MLSLNRRLLLMAGLVLLAFLGLTGGVLDRAFRSSLEQAQRDRLQGTLYTLLAAGELVEGELRLPASLPEARLSTPGSELYAQVLAPRGRGWRSASLLGLGWQPELRLPPGESRFYTDRSGDKRLHALAYGLSWEDDQGHEARFTLHVAEGLTAYQAQLAAFRASLWGWLGAVAAALLIAQLLVLRWSLRPLRLVARDLRAIEQGRADYLSGRYPAEIAGLTLGLNALLKSERSRAQRYRDTLANLAHSLKTPLTVLRGALEGQPSTPPEALEQIGRIDAAVEYQLRRAASAGHEPLAAPLAVPAVMQRLLRALAKAYAGRPLAVELRCAEDAMFYGQEGDLMELLGNLLDNGYKWARGRLRVSVATLPAGPAGRRGLAVAIEDDGAGVDPALAEAVLQRGRRADQQVPGNGIGLAVVAEIVHGHQGRLRIDRGDLGGARVQVELPGA